MSGRTLSRAETRPTCGTLWPYTLHECHEEDMGIIHAHAVATDCVSCEYKTLGFDFPDTGATAF